MKRVSAGNPSVMRLLCFSCLGLMGASVLLALLGLRITFVPAALYVLAIASLVGLVLAAGVSLFHGRWRAAIVRGLLVCVCSVAAIVTLRILLFSTLVRPVRDRFAEHLMIPDSVGVADPIRLPMDMARFEQALTDDGGFFAAALSKSDGDSAELRARIPSLRQVATNNAQAFLEYIEASPNWHLFFEGKNRFAYRSWKLLGRPRRTLNGYVSKFMDWPSSDNSFCQVRCLLCLDRKQWGRYPVRVGDDAPHFGPKWWAEIGHAVSSAGFRASVVVIGTTAMTSLLR